MPRGNGKIILLGEHSVVYGRHALAAAIEHGVNATATYAEHSILEIPAWDLRIESQSRASDTKAQAIITAFDALLASYTELKPVHIRAEVALPAGAGLGCSAALAVAILRAIDELIGQKRNDAQIAETSLIWERVFHGTPSGVDSIAASYGGLHLFRVGDAPQRISCPTEFAFVVAHSGEAASTRSMVDSVARQYEKDHGRVEKTFDAIDSLVHNGATALRNGNLEALGELLNLNQVLLNSLMLSTATLEELCKAARDAGALGAKLTGAGGGGCMIALAANKDSAKDIENALSKQSRQCFISTVAS